MFLGYFIANAPILHEQSFAIWFVMMSGRCRPTFFVRVLTMIKFSIAVLAATMATTAFSQNLPKSKEASTAAMVELCSQKNDPVALNFCYGFGEGVFQANVTASKSNSATTVCLPAQATRAQLLDDFIAWTRKTPEVANWYASDAIMRYLNDTFSCKR